MNREDTKDTKRIDWYFVLMSVGWSLVAIQTFILLLVLVDVWPEMPLEQKLIAAILIILWAKE